MFTRRLVTERPFHEVMRASLLGDTELFIWDYTDPAKSAEAQVLNVDRGESKDHSKMNLQSALFKLPN